MTDLDAARAALGVGRDATWGEIRSAYRVLIRRAHPDVAGPGSGPRAARLNAAYRALARAHREGRGRTPVTGGAPGAGARRRPAGPPPPSSPPAAPPPPTRLTLRGDDTVWLPLPPGAAFAAIVDACHRIGEVTYVDRSCAIVEALVAVPGHGACSLVVSLEPESGGTEAFCTLEAIQHVASLPVAPVLQELVGAMAGTLEP